MFCLTVIAVWTNGSEIVLSCGVKLPRIHSHYELFTVARMQILQEESDFLFIELSNLSRWIIIINFAQYHFLSSHHRLFNCCSSSVLSVCVCVCAYCVAISTEIVYCNCQQCFVGLRRNQTSWTENRWQLKKKLYCSYKRFDFSRQITAKVLPIDFHCRIIQI